MPTLLHTEFMADICQHPADDTPRLIYADWLKEHDAWTWDTVLGHVLHHPLADGPRLLAALWLDEHGDPDRAEFIRVQCEMVRRTASCSLCNRIAGSDPNRCVPCTRLRRRERELLGENVSTDGQTVWPRYYRWCEEAGIDPRWVFVPGFGLPAEDLFGNHFRRGFVGEVTLTTEDFLLHAHVLFRAAPLTKVVLSDREPWFSGVSESRYWKRQDSDDEQICRWALPSCLYNLLHGKELVLPRYAHGGSWKRFENEMAALSALRAAALLWGRRQGWPCPRCEGDGWAHGSDRPFEWSADVDYLKCPICKGTGHTVKEG